MRYLGLALYSEGDTDYRFLSSVIRRTVTSLYLAEAGAVLEVGEIHRLLPPPGPRSLAMRIVQAADRAAGLFHILLVHTDGSGDPAGARAERVDPAAEGIARVSALRGTRVVPVVPVRETEAWALADGDALREAFSSLLSNDDLGIPARAREVEAIRDPKLRLDLAYRKVAGGRRARKVRASSFLGAIGERVRLECLDRVPSFAALRTDLRGALRVLGYLPMRLD